MRESSLISINQHKRPGKSRGFFVFDDKNLQAWVFISNKYKTK